MSEGCDAAGAAYCARFGRDCLVRHAGGFSEYLRQLGYSAATVEEKCRLLGHLGPPCRAFSPHARAKKLARAAEWLVYSLTPSGFLGGKPPKNRGFVGILRGQKCLKRGQKCLRRRFSWRSPVERTAAPVAQPIGVAASPEIACEAIVCVAAGWFRRTRRSRRCQRCVPE